MIEAIAPGTILADTDSKLTASLAVDLHNLGFKGIIRYVGRHTPQSSGDLDLAEAQAILSTGMGLLVVQHCPRAFTPSLDLGAAYGHTAVVKAMNSGYPGGATLWLDFENCKTAVGATDYINAWTRVVRMAGYVPGLYYGADSPLSPDDLYWRLSLTRYWRAGSRMAPVIPNRGACLQQSLTTQAAGIDIDQDVAITDAFGGACVWWRS